MYLDKVFTNVDWMFFYKHEVLAKAKFIVQRTKRDIRASNSKLNWTSTQIDN